MKTLLILFILMILWLFTLPVYGSTWEPTVEWVIEVQGGEFPFTVYVQSEHYRVKWDGSCPQLFERVEAAEYLLHYAIEAQARPVATPEPVTLLLLGSGLVGLVWARRKR